MQHESDTEGGRSDDEDDKDQRFEDKEWNSIGNDDEDDCGSEKWETEDDGDDKDNKDNNDSFQEGIVNVSDDEIQYDKGGNVIGEEDIGEGQFSH